MICLAANSHRVMQGQPSENPVRVNVFFVASPLHYYCSEKLARTFHLHDFNVVVFYKSSVKDLGLNSDVWSRTLYIPWPRFEPLPGLLGKWRRMLSNMEMVAAVVPCCGQLYLHAPVIDTEAINYFINFFSKRLSGAVVKVRIIPDGLLNIQRHRLSIGKMVMQRVAKLRRVLDSRFDFYIFSGDRTGADAPIVDRIYVLGGLPHEYPREKVAVLPELVPTSAICSSDAALVLGQPLAGVGALGSEEVEKLARGLHDHLVRLGCKKILYKAHPRDPLKEFLHPDYEILEIAEPLESHMAKHGYPVVAGICSTGLITAKMMYGDRSRIIAYGVEHVREKTPGWRDKTKSVFQRLGIELVEHH